MFKTSKEVTSAIDKARRGFFWKELDEQDQPCRKMHASSWFLLCQPKHTSGLWIDNLEFKNEACWQNSGGGSVEKRIVCGGIFWWVNMELIVLTL